MKKFLSLLLAMLILMSSAIIANAAPNDIVYIYAPDGRTSLVMEYEIDYYQNLGWYTYPVITMYAADGRETIVRPEEEEYYKNLGWYTQPVVTLYNIDGGTNIVFEWEVEYYQSLGWYTEPLVTMYNRDGGTNIVFESEVEYYKTKGWYTQPVNISNEEYYPGTNIPTFDSVTGIRLTKKEKAPDGGTLYTYKFRNMPEAETWFVYNDYLLEVAGCTFISGKVANSDEHALIGLYTKGESGILFGIEFENDTLFVIPLE